MYSDFIRIPTKVIPMQLSKKKKALSLSIVFISIISFVSMISAEYADSVRNVAPGLITSPLIPATLEMLKGGLWGTTSVDVALDSAGSIISYAVAPSGNPVFDSLVKSSIAQAHFTPAIENSRAVSSNVNFEITLPYDSLVNQCMRFRPKFTGSVIDTIQKTPLPKARILLQYADSTEDKTITTGFDNYLSMIGKGIGQKYNGKVLASETDSLGRFSFRLLPVGHISVSVQTTGYEIEHFQGYITRDSILQCIIIPKPSETHASDSSYAITVYGRPSFTKKKIIVAEEEKHIGFSPFLSNVVQAKAEIRRVPEGPSKMLVRSGCPYDNLYVIAGVSMLAPFHFGGYPYADIDGLMISALSSVNVTVNDITAKRIDASGCIVEADPGKITYDNGCQAKGFYLRGDFSMIGVDLLAAYSSRKNTGDYLQIGYSVSDDYYIVWNDTANTSIRKGNQGIGIPLGYGNATITGSKSIGRSRCSSFGWFAWDSYDVTKANSKAAQRIRDSIVVHRYSKKTNFPWGMGSIRFTKDSSDKSLTIGGAHQFFGSGKKNGLSAISNRSFINNGEITADFDTIIRKPFVEKLTARITHDEWSGLLTDQKNDSVIDTICTPHGIETAVHLNTSFIRQTANLIIELDLLASAIHHTGFNQITGDAGASATYTFNNYQAGIHFGRVTSRPDIRGLPDSIFRRQLNHTYIASMPLFFSQGIISKAGITPYARYSTDAPQLDPVKQIWNPTCSTPVRAFGADIDCRIVPFSWAELSTALNLANAQRLNSNNDLLAYEWNLPWTVRSGLHIYSKNDRFHFYADYICSKGLPYYDLDNQVYAALPVYRSFDINLQFRTRMPRERYINKLDCYATLKNVQDLLGTSNVRDYYWDSNGIRQSVYLGNGRMDIGLRFGIRL